jgi:hypothetical protein
MTVAAGGAPRSSRFFAARLLPNQLTPVTFAPELQVVPDAAVVALLLTPNNPEIAVQPQDFEQAARKLNRQFDILNASSDAEIVSSFGTPVERRVGALVEGSDPLFSNNF